MIGSMFVSAVSETHVCSLWYTYTDGLSKRGLEGGVGWKKVHGVNFF